LVIIKNELFKREKNKSSFVFALMAYLEVNKNYIGRCVITPKGILGMFNMKLSKSNLEKVAIAIETLINLNIIEYEIFNDEKIEKINYSTVFFIKIKRDGRQFRSYDDDFMFHTLKKIKYYKNFEKLLEVYFFILSQMHQDMKTYSLSSRHVSQSEIIKNTSVNSRKTIASYVNILKDEELLEVELFKNEETDNMYNIYSFPDHMK